MRGEWAGGLPPRGQGHPQIPNIFRTFSEHFPNILQEHNPGERQGQGMQGAPPFPNISEHFRTFPKICGGGGEGLPPSDERHPAVPNISQHFPNIFAGITTEGRGGGEVRERPSPIQNMYRTCSEHSPPPPRGAHPFRKNLMARPIRSKTERPCGNRPGAPPEKFARCFTTQLIEPRSIQQNCKGSCAYGVTGRGTEVGDATGTIPSNDRES